MVGDFKDHRSRKTIRVGIGYFPVIVPPQYLVCTNDQCLDRRYGKEQQKRCVIPFVFDLP